MNNSHKSFLIKNLIGAKLSYWGFPIKIHPITLTFSVTNRCQSRCRTCKIWEIYKQNPAKRFDELTIDEIEKSFKSLGQIYFFNISGGEPFLRADLPKIIELASLYLKPAIYHIPTNALIPLRIERFTKEIIGIIEKNTPGSILTIKPSIDGYEDLHDKIRGVKGNFGKVEDITKKLLEISKRHNKFMVELGTVISKDNIDLLDPLIDYVHSLGVQSYRHEIAEERFEFKNFGDNITPSEDEYLKLINSFKKKTLESIKKDKKRRYTKLTELLRVVYYDLAYDIIAKKKQVIPCYGGITNIHLDPYGEVWSCCVKGDELSLGNVREHDYDIAKIINSVHAKGVRAKIKHRECYCPLANQSYSNILLAPFYLLRKLLKIYIQDVK
jgi:MoaA/NifB/PqqE/SkfB family radical SAM enzyme